MRTLRRRWLRPRASTLVITLLVIVVLSTIVVAFMQSMAIERMVSRSYADMSRARLASEAGLNAVVSQLQMAIGTNQAYLVGLSYDALNYGPVTTIGVTNLTNGGQLMPLISGDLGALNGFPSPALTNALATYLNARTNLQNTVTINVNLKNRLIQKTTDTNLYRAPWVYIVDSAGKTNARFAYIVLDESARLDANASKGSARDNGTNWFSGPEVLPLHTGGTNLLSATESTNVAMLIHPTVSLHTVGQAFSNWANYEQKKHLLTVNRPPSPDVIPLGYYSNNTFVAFPDGGKPKYNINDLATNPTYGATSSARAENLASIIVTNLPLFGKRDLGLQSEDSSGRMYVNRLAANIVDYIDSDSIPTSANSGEPAGNEALPHVVMVAEKNTWVSESSGPPYTIVIRSEFFAQLWNPYSVPVSGTAKLEISRRQAVEMRNGGSSDDLADFTSQSINVSLRPNEFKAVRFGSADQNFVNFVNRPSQVSSNYPTWAATSSANSSINGHPHFRFFWNNNLSGMNRSDPENGAPAASGLSRNNPGNTFGGIGAIRWSYNFQPANAPNTVGDPRITYLSETDWLVVGAANTGHTAGLWQGRQQDGAAQRSQDFKTTWANRDFIPQNSLNQGIALSSASGDPTALASQYNGSDANTFVASIKNGPMQSIGELGHIFDPVQVNDTGGNASTADQGYFRPGGGYSLRIGQPDFTPFNLNGRRAIELIDLFSVNSTNTSSSGYPVARSRINVNTAPIPVLEALFYNIKVTSDAASTNSAISATNATTLANLVISNRPYNRLSELYKVTAALANATNFTPALGSTNQATNVMTPLAVAGVFDRAREEAFGKMVELAAVQSRSFRVYVVGQALGPNLKLRGQSALEASVSVQIPASGRLVPVISDVRQEE